ncbi:hypothetical protein [Roseovarius tolerans]|uniref:hypothetical protein n=1 Tax=Roseovarius tolerans TaxID=74031 RepID=UPI0015871853|nr:hypothetical protein [Roseovarius tolerans]
MRDGITAGFAQSGHKPEIMREILPKLLATHAMRQIRAWLMILVMSYNSGIRG